MNNIKSNLTQNYNQKTEIVKQNEKRIWQCHRMVHSIWTQGIWMEENGIRLACKL